MPFMQSVENFSPEEAVGRSLTGSYQTLSSTFGNRKDIKILGYLEGPVVRTLLFKDIPLQREVKIMVIWTEALSLWPAFLSRKMLRGWGSAQLLEAMRSCYRRWTSRHQSDLPRLPHRLLRSMPLANEGLSQSTYAGATWFDMVWENPRLKLQKIIAS